MPVVEINGHACHYDVVGDGPPLLFMHGGYGGLGTGAAPEPPAWRDAVSRLFTVVTYDRRSTGRSEASTVRHSLDLFRADAWELLQHLGIEEAVIWGESAGAPIAMTFVAAHPRAARALVLTDAAPWFSRDPVVVDRLRERIAVLHDSGAEAAYEERRTAGAVGLQSFTTERLDTLTDDERRAREEQLARVRADLAAVPREQRIEKYGSELRTYEAYLDFDFTAQFPLLDLPVFVAYGTADSIFPAVEWDRLSADAANVTYLPIEGGEHGCAKGPEAIAAVIDFLKTLG